MSLEKPPATAADRATAAGAGLCASCRHLQVLRSPRSIFVRCARHDEDPKWPKYPRLPVLRCEGFEPATDDGTL